MKISGLFGVTLASLIALTGVPAHAGGRKKTASSLSISLDASRKNVVVSWTGEGTLKEAKSLRGRTRNVSKGKARRRNVYVAPITGSQSVYNLGGSGGSGSIFTANVVGYVNLTLPPGLTLLANPLHFENSTVGYWLPSVPDGSQVYKLDANGNYEVTTFDQGQGGWSHPDMTIPIGTGFYFHNPSTTTYNVTFVGEIPLGELVNPLPAGISTKGALVPQSGSINSLHHIPGEPGDVLQVYVNDLNGGGAYQSSVYDAQDGWVPDLTLGVGQGFWIEKQNPQDWVRFFSVN